jgi:membrane associated rhomboid family serine protease
MFPIGTVGRTNIRPYATFFIIVVNVFFFIAQMLIQAQGAEAATNFYATYALSMCRVGQESVLLTMRNGMLSLFLHANFAHLFFNMVMLWIFASRVEDYFGARRFVMFYVVAGFAAHIAQTVLGAPVCDASLPGGGGIMIGASGAIAGVMGAYLFLHPGGTVRTALIFFRIPFGVVNMSAWFYLGYWIVLEIIQGVGILPTDGIGHWAHIGGFVGGFVVIFIATLFKPAPDVDPLESLDLD